MNGTTVKTPVFYSDEKDRYLHIYYSFTKAASEKSLLESIIRNRFYTKLKDKVEKMDEMYHARFIGHINNLPNKYLGWIAIHRPLRYNKAEWCRKNRASQERRMGRMQKKKLPVGIEDFEEIRTEGFYYIDETLFDGLTMFGIVCECSHHC